MDMKFILTIDTEGDNQWEHGQGLSVENIKYVPRFQDLCTRYKVKPTYLVTSEVCDDAFAKEIFSEYSLSKKAEIGAHLHSWTTPPFLNKEGYRHNDINHAFANELPTKLLADKIKYLTNQIENSFGKRPQSFRSGRYGFNKDVANLLMENSYLVDSSVTPFTSWSSHIGIPNGTGGPDFQGEMPYPFYYDFDNGSLLEIPVTILPTIYPLTRNKTIANYYFKNVNYNLFLKILRKIYFKNQPLWLRPHPWMNINSFEELLNEAINIKLPYIVMMFHSSELMPGCSIYRPDNNSIEQLFDLLECFFSLLQKNNIQSITLTEAAKIYKL